MYGFFTVEDERVNMFTAQGEGDEDSYDDEEDEDEEREWCD